MIGHAGVYLIPVICALVLAACGSIGEKDFACPGRPPGVRCMSASEVYRATHHTDVVEPTSKQALGDNPKQTDSGAAPEVRRASGTARRDRGRPSRELVAEQPKAQQPMLSTDRPVPIRTPAQVMRVWIAPWEDTRGILHGGEHAFIEIVERRWSVGERETSEPARFFSLQSTPDPTPESGNRKPATASGSTSRSQSSAAQPSPKQGESR